MAIGTEGVTFGSAEGVVITPGFLLIAAVFVEIAVLIPVARIFDSFFWF
jgi:hypothetical protein